MQERSPDMKMRQPEIGITRSSDLLGPRASRPQTRRGAATLAVVLQSLFALRAHCGRDARGPSKSLDRTSLR